MKRQYGVVLLTIALLSACGTKTAVQEKSALSKPSSSSVGSVSATSQSNSSAVEKVPLQSESSQTNQGQTATGAGRTEANPPMDEETAKRLLIAPTGGQRVTLSITPQLQQVHNYCAPTTVSMMLSSRGVHVDQYQLAREMGTYEPFGTHNRDAIRILNRHLFGYEAPTAQQAGYRLATVTSASPEELQLFKERLRQNIADGYPMYYTFDCAKIYPGFRGEHNAIGIGYELTLDGQDIANIYYLDPMPALQDPTYGSLKKVSPQLLLEAMLTCQEPDYGW